jgi:hypothetical protein
LYFNPQSPAYRNDQGSIKNKSFQLVIILLLLATALGIRFYHIKRPLLDFAPVRQYQSAHIARGLFYERNDSISESKKEMAKLNTERMGYVLEPRIIENAAVFGYRIIGAEHLWIPRVLSAVFWVIGGFFLYLIDQKIASPNAAFFSIVFYLFNPYSIPASRSFQPDPLMTMMIIISIYTIMRYNDRPSGSRLLIAAAVSAAAIFIKPYSVFIIFCTYILFSIYRKGIWRSLLNLNFLIFAVISMMPVILYYVPGLFSDVGYLREHAQNSFVPHIIWHSYFWKDWYRIIGEVVGYIPFLVALVGLFVARGGIPRISLTAFWISYFIFGIAATHHIHTHTYYHMQFIPVVSLSLGPAIDELVKRLSHREFKVSVLTIFVVISLAIISSIGTSNEKWKDIGLKNKLKTLRTIIGLNPEFKKFLASDFEKEVTLAREIGEIVHHSTKTIFLTSDFGRSLAYHGELSGLPWPTGNSLLERKERGLRIPPKEELFNPRYFTIRTHDKYIQYSPDFFIIMDFKEYDEQKDLKEFLNTNFPVISKNDDYIIFDLRSMNRPDNTKIN